MKDFGDLVARHVEESTLSYSQLEALSGIPKTTISSWANGYTKRPRSWRDVLKVAAALRLNEAEATDLLEAAAHRPLAALLREAEPAEQDLFEPWIEARQTARDAPFQVPREDLADFVGREMERQIVRRRLLSKENLCIIHGMPGVGKTALAIRVAYQLRYVFHDGVLWATLPVPRREQSPAERLAPVLRSFIEAGGGSVAEEETVDLHSLSRRMRQILANRKALIVLDDIHDDEELEWLLPPAGNCAVLVTTRDQSIAAGRNVSPILLEPWALEDALALLEGIAGLELASSDRSAAQDIVELAGRLPLAVRLVASHLSRLHDITLAEYRGLLAEQPERLFRRIERGTAKGVWQSFELAFKLLPKELKDLFPRLATFRSSSFSAEAVTALLEGKDPLAVRLDLDDLVALSLVETVRMSTTQGHGTRYQLHRLLREFALAKLDDQFHETMDRFAEYFVAFTQRHSTDGYAVLDPEWPNIRLALDWFQRRQNWKKLATLSENLTRVRAGIIGYLDARGYWHVAADALGTLRDSGQALNDDEEEAVLLFKRGVFALRLSQPELAEEHLLGSFKILESLTNGHETALYQAYVCEVLAELSMQRESKAALAWANRGLSILEQIEDRLPGAEKGYLMIRHATIMARSGRLNEARENIEAALDLLPSDPTAARVSGLITLGNIHNIRGESEQARRLWLRGIEDAEALGDNRRLATLWRNLAIQAEEAGELARCLEFNSTALELYRRINDIAGEGHVSSNLAFIHLMLLETDQAEQYLEIAKELATENLLTDLLLFVTINQTRWHLQRDELDAAEEQLERSRQLNEDLSLAHVRAEVFRLEAIWALESGMPEEGLVRIDASLAAANDQGQPIELGRSLRVKGDVLAQLGQSEQAAAAYRKSLEAFEDKNQFERARSQLAWAKHAAEVGDADQERQLLLSARETFQATSASRWLATANDEIAELQF